MFLNACSEKTAFKINRRLILCIDWAKGCSDYTLFLGVSVRVSPDDISIWTGGLGKADAPPQGEWASSNPLRAWTEKCREKESLPLFASYLPAWTETSVFPHPWPGIYTTGSLGPQTFGFRLDLHHQLPGSPACRQQIVGFLSPQKHVSQFLIINLFAHIYVPPPPGALTSPSPSLPASLLELPNNNSCHYGTPAVSHALCHALHTIISFNPDISKTKEFRKLKFLVPISHGLSEADAVQT